MISYHLTITDKAGREVQLTGSSDLMDRIEKILEGHGFKWNGEVECLDEGYYDPPKYKIHKSGSVECPHCHWGFAPSVIEQHIREKH